MAWEAGGDIKPGNRQSREFWWGVLVGVQGAHTTEGQFLEGEIVQNQHVNNLFLKMKGGKGTWNTRGQVFVPLKIHVCKL